jgi:hypothetical protein
VENILANESGEKKGKRKRGKRDAEALRTRRKKEGRSMLRGYKRIKKRRHS